MFVALLQKVQLDRKLFFLTLHDGDRPVRVAVNDRPDQYATAKLAVALLFRYYNTNLDIGADPFVYADVHHSKLCVVQYALDSRGTLQDLLPWKLDLLPAALQRQVSQTIVPYLRGCHASPTDAFRFDQLLSELPSWLSAEPLSPPPLWESSQEAEARGHRQLKAALAAKMRKPDYRIGDRREFHGYVCGVWPAAFADIAALPAHSLHLYVASQQSPDRFLVVDGNCRQVTMTSYHHIHKVFGSIIGDSQTLKELLLRREIALQLELQRRDLAQGYHTTFWTLTRCTLETASTKTPVPDEPAPPVATRKGDPLVWFKDLQLDSSNPRYVVMFGFLVACEDNAKFHKMIFTDFTQNDKVPQKYLFDRFLVDYENKLSEFEGFRCVIYPNQYEIFETEVARITGMTLSQMHDANNYNVSKQAIVCKLSLKVKLYDGKLNAIVRDCTPITNDTVASLDRIEQQHLMQLQRLAISRISQDALSWNLKSFARFFPLQEHDYTINLTTKTTSDYEELANLLSEDDDDHFANSQSNDIQDSQPVSDLEDISDLDSDRDLTFNTDIVLDAPIIEYTDFSALNKMPAESRAIYKIDAKVLAFTYHQTSLSLIVAAPETARGLVPPQDILQMEWKTGQAVSTFFNNELGNADTVEKKLNFLLDKTFTFKITRAKRKLSSTTFLAIWVPLECTLEELRSQLVSGQEDYDTLAIKQEQT